MLRVEAVSQLFSEPDHGIQLWAEDYRATRDGEAFVVNGQKRSLRQVRNTVTGCPDCQDAPKVFRGITQFPVDMQAPGIGAHVPLRQITGSAHFNEVYLTDASWFRWRMWGGCDR